MALVVIRWLTCSQLLLKESYSFSELLHLVCWVRLSHNSYPFWRRSLLTHPLLLLFTFPLFLKLDFLKEGHESGRSWAGHFFR